MTNLEQFHQVRQVVENFSERTLQSISGDVSRLLYVATLRDLATGRYHHVGLASLYSEAVVDQALRLCHEELFERILETELEIQENELRTCLGAFEVGPREIAARWLEHEFYRFLIPSDVPLYLRKLFCSNLAILLQLIVAEDSNRR
jgi:hypothetical protein